ncbi:hypothetical protein E1H12_06340 [Geitlerinema sp. P-1104]|uniref:hypothetical protein n=1 Tax=Geitlerinema sp. P-1104 TaxID=2546230 RepID=UPI001476ADE7|nr:hypothetical protein [Geitlerinema sp. P-1104]NMG58151.1 hypothetical protein [Geitlerinema sp. P-1104]
MKNRNTLTIGFLGLSLWLSSIPVRASECTPTQVQPASETREIINQEYNLRFEIPRNYQTSSNRHDSRLVIAIRNPGDVAFEACIAEPGNSGNSRYVATDVTVSIEDLPANIVSLSDLLNYLTSQTDGSVRIEQHSVETIQVDGQDGVLMTEDFWGTRSRFPETNRYAYILHPNGQHLIRIRAWQLGRDDVDAVDLDIQRLILSTLSFL